MLSAVVFSATAAVVVAPPTDHFIPKLDLR